MWREEATYYVYLGKQMSPGWRKAREKRLTASSFGAVANPTFYKGWEDVIKSYSKKGPRKASIQQIINCNRGIKTEPEVREWYSFAYGVDVEEVGLLIPKWDTRIGCSPDGLVGEKGMIEIKCPTSMYNRIKNYRKKREEGWIPPEGYHDHIWDSHYDQMQGSMQIAGREWCDYILYCPIHNNKSREIDTFVERIYRNDTYWNEHLYPAINSFLSEHKHLFVSKAIIE